MSLTIHSKCSIFQQFLVQMKKEPELILQFNVWIELISVILRAVMVFHK